MHDDAGLRVRGQGRVLGDLVGQNLARALQALLGQIGVDEDARRIRVGRVLSPDLAPGHEDLRQRGLHQIFRVVCQSPQRRNAIRRSRGAAATANSVNSSADVTGCGLLRAGDFLAACRRPPSDPARMPPPPERCAGRPIRLHSPAKPGSLDHRGGPDGSCRDAMPGSGSRPWKLASLIAHPLNRRAVICAGRGGRKRFNV